MGDVFDLDAAEAEVVRAPYTFVWDGREWQLVNAFKLPLNMVEKAMAGDFDAITAAIRAGLGEQHKDFAKARPLNLDAMKILFDRWTDHDGQDAGESSGSSDSSGSTGEPSKRTSAATTASASTGRSTATKRNGTRRAS